MSVVPLPAEPNLAHLKKLAKELRHSVLAGEAAALGEVAEHFPPPVPEPFPLHAAQLVLARHYGFASWARLTQHLAVVAEFTRAPDRTAAGTTPGDEFVRLACLTYGDDSPERRAGAHDVLAAQPDLARTSIHAAAVLADVAAVERHLAADPLLARVEGGPFAWEPLFCLAYARVDPPPARADVLATARALLQAGGDPNTGYLWHGLPTPFTVLTGAFGEGERGPRDQPRHPYAIDLARVLLDAGADANDGQTLYNRMFGTDNDHLALLFEYGLGHGDGGPWKARLGDAIATPAELVRGQLEWAVTHDQPARVELVADNGVDLDTPLPDGRTPMAAAALSGSTGVVEVLRARSARAGDLDAADTLIAAVLRGDRARVEQATDDAIAAARARRPALVVDAATTDRIETVRIAIELGFDVNARGRIDRVPGAWETALHYAAMHDDTALAMLLVDHGADLDATDVRFDNTPQQWAEHFDNPEMAELLRDGQRRD